MNTKIQSVGFTAKPTLIDFVKEKTKKLFRLYGRALNCEVVFKIEKSETKDDKICDIRLVVPGYDMLASARSNTFEGATMLAIESLERQIRKRKTRSRKLSRASLFTKMQRT